jgi:hypothetical protein
MTNYEVLKNLATGVLDDLNPGKIESYIDEAYGLTQENYILLVKKNLSLQSLRIQLGNQTEILVNKIVSHLGINLIEDEVIVVGKYKKGEKKGQDKVKVVKTNKVKVGNKNRQVDHYIRIKRKDGVWKLYLESKCNVVFDTEKKGESNAKVLAVAKALGADEGVYFIPVLKTIPPELAAQYPDIKILGLQDLFDLIPDCPFTADMVFELYKEFAKEFFAKLEKDEV